MSTSDNAPHGSTAVTAPAHPRYVLRRLLATGGMGQVWAAEDTLLDREVAVKVLKREYAEDPVFRARFVAEARHAAALQHPNVAAVLDYDEVAADPAAAAPPLPILVMELVEGRPLSALIADSAPFDPAVAADLVAQAAEGIDAAHRLGIVHRDAKPSNLLVTPAGQVKVTDFGIARAADTVPLTVTGHIVGTPHYLSPEQADGGSATPSSDVYSLGIVLFECLTGRKPFQGETPVATALMQVRDPLPPLPGTVPGRLQRIVQVATAKDPAARFPSAGALAAALREQAPETRSFVMPAEDTGPAAQDESAADRAGRRPRMVPALALLTALGVIAVLGALAVLSAGDEPAAGPTPGASRPVLAESPAPVRLREAAYLGLPAATAVRRLRALGLDPHLTATRAPNTGDEVAGTVAALTPTGLVAAGEPVSLQLFAVAPSPDPPVVTGGSGAGRGGSGDPSTERGAHTGGPRGKGGSAKDKGRSDDGKAGAGKAKGGKGGAGKAKSGKAKGGKGGGGGKGRGKG